MMLVVVRRTPLGFGRSRSGPAGSGAVALGAGQRVLEDSLEADLFLDYYRWRRRQLHYGMRRIVRSVLDGVIGIGYCTCFVQRANIIVS